MRRGDGGGKVSDPAQPRSPASPLPPLPPLSPRNARLQQVRRLGAQRRARRAEGRYLIEGPVLVAEAAASGVALDAVYVEVGTQVPAVGADVPVVAVQPGALAKVGDVVTGRGVIAVAAIPPPPPPPTGGLVLVLVDVADPGNVGTLLRTADAVGAAAVVTSGGTADVWSPKVVRASAGSLFHVDVLESVDPVGLLRDHDVRTVATVVEGGVPYDQADLSSPVAVVLGSEARGLPPEVTGGCEVAVTIPLAGRAESLNVAMAGTVIAFEWLRRTRQGAAPSPGRANDWTSRAADARVSER